MEAHEELLVPCDADELAPWVDDLSAYPQWMGLVHRAERLADGEWAWKVDLRARLGPLARSKRLRMVRMVNERPGIPPAAGAGTVRFERQELDGRRHGRWELSVQYGPADPGDATTSPQTRLVVELRYEGSFWTAGLLERILHDEIERAKVRLVELLSEGRGPGDVTDEPRR